MYVLQVRRDWKSKTGFAISPFFTPTVIVIIIIIIIIIIIVIIIIYLMIDISLRFSSHHLALENKFYKMFGKDSQESSESYCVSVSRA